MENAREALSHILLSKKEKCIQNCMRQCGKKNCAVDQNSVSDKNDLLLDRSFNTCCFCTKVFVNSKFLIQHILRRHSENLVVMYRKLYDLNVADHLSQNDMINIITSEFSKLKSDLESIKSSLPGYQSNPNQSNSVNPIEIQSSSLIKESNGLKIQESFAAIARRVDALTAEFQALRVTNVKIEKDIGDLKVQWNESDAKSLCNSSDVKDSLIYQTLKNDLLFELQSLIAENNEKLKLSINQLSLNCKADVRRLENSIETNLEKIDTSSLVQETLKSLEKEIDFFFSCHKAKKFKTHTSEVNLSKGITPKVRKVKPSFNQKKTVNFGSGENPLLLETKLNSLNISADTKKSPFLEHKIKKSEAQDSELNLTEKINRKVKEFESNSSQEIVDVGAELETRLNALNIPSGTERLSNTDYTAKMKLVELERTALSKKYPSFSDIYQCLNSSLDKNVSQKLKACKKLRKIRFSLTPTAPLKKFENKAEGSDTKLPGKLSDLQYGSSIEDISVWKSGNSPTPIGDTKLAERLSNLPDGSPVEDSSVMKSERRNITAINVLDTELANRNLRIESNSAASLKLISCSNKKRKLPSVPEELSQRN